MQNKDERIVLSATDLANHLACRHLTELNRKLAHGELKKPYRDDPILETIIARGNEHEAAYVEQLRENGHGMVELPKWDDDAFEKTLQAMREGVDVIVQAGLKNDRWLGRPDLLIRTIGTSNFGDWTYEVADTKLTRNTKAGTILQLCLYSDLLAEAQGSQPESMSVIKPGAKPGVQFEIEPYRFDDFAAYYRFVKQQLESTIDSDPNDEVYPDPVPHCGICRWWSRCDGRRREDDHLSFVAGIQRSHIVELEQQGMDTLAKFAAASKPLAERPKRGSMESFDKVHKQAGIQLKGRNSGKPEYEFIEVELPLTERSATLAARRPRGFLRLPAPSPGDVFFDIEGDPHAGTGGLEYLFGYVTKPDEGDPKYEAIWAINRDEEERMFKQFIDMIFERRNTYDGMHIYHYAPYEPSALLRLANRYGTRRAELKDLLNDGSFVDLYAVVRQGLRCSVESYSIKKLEAFYGYDRLEELESARHSLHRIERILELGCGGSIAEADKQTVQTYNEDDCRSTLALRDWLELKRDELVATGANVPRPEPIVDEEDEPSFWREQIEALYQQLVADIDPDNRDGDDDARWLLAHLLDYFGREYSVASWEYHRLHDLEPDELVADRHAIYGLSFVKETPKPPRVRNATHRYQFEPQEVSFEPGRDVYEAGDHGGARLGTVAGIDASQGLIDIRKTAATEEIHPSAIIVDNRVRPRPMPESLLDFASIVADSSKTNPPKSARYDLLCGNAPRFKSKSLPVVDVTTKAAIELAADLDGSVLAIQGPPGAGKTFTGSHMIAALARNGKRVGITAVSHKVISNLLKATLKNSKAEGAVQVAHRKGDTTEFVRGGLEMLGDTASVLTVLDEGKVVGGTAWLWANPQLEQQLDYLFVDEAGQMSLAMVLAAGRAAKNIVLLGDPQQLEQPQRADHPEGSVVAALSHILGGHKTIPPERGLFLKGTYRLHPNICEFTSEQFYENRLASESHLNQQVVLGPSSFTGTGLRFVGVEHEGNQSRSDEEVEVVSQIVNELNSGHTWRNEKSETIPLEPRHILVVAPYNSQVAAIRRAIKKSANVGTVDKFQGQEGAVVVYSLTSSSIEDAPRGIEFLFSGNRLNVATSRARCLTIVVGTPELFAPWCNSVRQIGLANGFCRYLELAAGAAKRR